MQTPERIEFSNLSTHMSSDQEDSLSQMDEDEWTDRNFGASTAEVCSSDNEEDSSSSRYVSIEINLQLYNRLKCILKLL